MSRSFNGTTDIITDDLASAAVTMPITGALSALVVIRITTTSDTTWASFIEGEESGGTIRMAFGRNNSGNLYYADENGNSGGGSVAIQDADNWCVAAVTKATGSAVPNFYKRPIGGSTSSGTGTAATSPDAAWNGFIHLGGDDDRVTMRLAAAALFNKVLSQAEVEGVETARTTASINALGPLWLADDSDGFATDLISERALVLTGTADDADDPASWVYGLGGAPGPSQRFMWMP